MKLKMCPNCYNIYTMDHINIEFCPDYNCDTKSELFDIDDAIAEPIQKLNRLGYKTKFCCAGHQESPNNISHPYVWFQKHINLPQDNNVKIDNDMDGTHISHKCEEDVYKAVYEFRKYLFKVINFLQTKNQKENK